MDAQASYVGESMSFCIARLLIPTLPPSKMGSTMALLRSSAKGVSTSYAELDMTRVSAWLIYEALDFWNSIGTMSRGNKTLTLQQH